MFCSGVSSTKVQFEPPEVAFCSQSWTMPPALVGSISITRIWL
jgi:hypothetical protein